MAAGSRGRESSGQSAVSPSPAARRPSIRDKRRPAFCVLALLLAMGAVMLATIAWVRPTNDEGTPHHSRGAVPPLDAPLPPSDLRATITALDAPATIGNGEQMMVQVRVRNDGDRPWPVAPPEGGQYVIHLGGRWFDPRGNRLVRDDARAALTYPLYPDEEATVALTITAPQAGLYTLEIDLVQEGVAWSGASGGTPARLVVRVLP